MNTSRCIILSISRGQIKKTINDHITGTRLSQTELKPLRNNLITFHDEAIKCHHAFIEAVTNISERQRNKLQQRSIIYQGSSKTKQYFDNKTTGMF